MRDGTKGFVTRMTNSVTASFNFKNETRVPLSKRIRILLDSNETNTKFKQILTMTGWFSAPNDCAADSFLKGLKPVIFVGRLLGVFSERDISCESAGLRCSKFERLHSGSLILFFLINFIFQSMANFKRFELHETTSPKLQELVLPGYSFTLFFIFTYISFNTRKLQKLIQKLSDISREFSATQIQRSASVSTYPRFCLIVLMVILIYGILENLAYDIQAFSTETGEANSTLQRYYLQLSYHWAHILPYNPVLTFMGIVLLKVGTYGWIFGDILTIVLCRVLSERLQDIRNEIQTLIDCVPDELISITEVIPNQGNKTKRFSVPWNDIRRQYLALSDLVREVGKFISPLILSCYGINVYLITINLFRWIAPNTSDSIEQTFYNYFAFAHFSFRVSSVTFYAAEVYHRSLSIYTTLQKCPNCMYSLSMERLERTLIWNPCGIFLFSTFMITRKFFISIIGFLFTTQIVLLQTNSNGSSNNANA